MVYSLPWNANIQALYGLIMRQQSDSSQSRGDHYEGRMHAAHCTLRKGTWTRISLATCPHSAILFTARKIIRTRKCARSREEGTGEPEGKRDGRGGMLA